MSNVTRLPPFPKTVHVEADIVISQRDEFERAIVQIVAAAARWRVLLASRGVRKLWHTPSGTPQRSRE